MTKSVDKCRTRFDSTREVFEVQEGQPTKTYIAMIVEAIGEVLYTYTLRYDVDKGKDNLIVIIIDDFEYVKKFGCSFRRPTHPRVYGPKLKGEKVIVEIRKVEAAHKAKIQDWDLYDKVEEESCRFTIDSVNGVACGTQEEDDKVRGGQGHRDDRPPT